MKITIRIILLTIIVLPHLPLSNLLIRELLIWPLLRDRVLWALEKSAEGEDI